MQKAGSTDEGRFAELRFAIEDQESENEIRDLSLQVKTAMPTDPKDKPKHHEYGAIGTSTCNKQKSVTKLFVENLSMLDK